jgi:hypothetical protein
LHLGVAQPPYPGEVEASTMIKEKGKRKKEKGKRRMEGGERRAERG